MHGLARKLLQGLQDLSAFLPTVSAHAVSECAIELMKYVEEREALEALFLRCTDGDAAALNDLRKMLESTR
jgi:hypothetical protein